MSFRNLILTTACALLAAAALHAQGPCMPFQASGTYMVKITGFATVATTPMPVFAPVVSIGMSKVDDSGNMTPLGPLVNVVGGTTITDSITAAKVTIASDCSVTFKASCAGGCTWEGSGVLIRGGQAKELHLMFTKTNGYPLTALVEAKQISN